MIWRTQSFLCVQVVGLEPTRIAPLVPKTSVYTNFTTPAKILMQKKSTRMHKGYYLFLTYYLEFVNIIWYNIFIIILNKNMPEDKKDIENNKVLAAISYLWILCLVPLFLKRDSKFAQFHAKQGLVLFVIGLIASFFFWFPLFGQVLMLGLFLVSIFGAYQALSGEWYKLPYIYDWSKKINL